VLELAPVVRIEVPETLGTVSARVDFGQTSAMLADVYVDAPKLIKK